MDAFPDNENKELSQTSNQVYCPLVDTHAHVNLDDFQGDLGDLIQRSRQGVFPPVRGKQVANGTIHPPRARAARLRRATFPHTVSARGT